MFHCQFIEKYQTASTIKIFWHSLCIEEPLQHLFAGRSKITVFISRLPTVPFNPCVRLGNNKLFYKGSTLCVWNSRAGGKHYSLLSSGTGNFTRFHLHKKWMPRSSPNRGGGAGGLKWLVHNQAQRWSVRKRGVRSAEWLAPYKLNKKIITVKCSYERLKKQV